MSGWIKADVTPPPKGVRVLACTHGGWVFTGMNFEIGDQINDRTYGVAYWRELPPLPDDIKEEKA